MLQAYGLGIGEVVRELLDVLDLGAPPAVDRLVVITHHHQACTATGEQTQPCVLDGVGILKLIHQDMTEASLIVLQQAGLIPPQI